MSRKVREAIADAAGALRAAGIDNAATDARRLVAHALEIAPDRLSLALERTIAPGRQTRIDAALAARLDRQPVSQITGRRMFWGRAFHVTPAVLDPRPETETLVAAALAAGFDRVLDLGVGSGCILLTLLAEREAASGLGADISDAALKVATLNRDRLGLGARAALIRSDWFRNITGWFDLIVANPPYIAAAEMATLAPEIRDWEPAFALSPGETGLEAFAGIAAGVAGHLAPRGRLFLECGQGQAGAVASLFRAAGLEFAAVHADMDGRDRVVEMRMPR